MMLEIPSRMYEALIPKQIETTNRLVWPSDVKFDLYVDVAEPETIRSRMRQLDCATERSMKNEGGDYYFLLNGHLAEVIERKAGMDLMASLNKGSKDDIRFGRERFNSQADKLGLLSGFRDAGKRTRSSPCACQLTFFKYVWVAGTLSEYTHQKMLVFVFS